MARTKNWNPETKRKQILNAAIAVLNGKHYRTCPVDEIARGAGIAKGTVYLYFKSKEELYFAVLCELIGRLQSMAEETDGENITAKQKLRLLLERMSVFFGAHKQLFASLHQEQKAARGKPGARLHEKFHALIATVSRIIERGIKNGELKNYPAPLVGAMFVSLTSVMARQKVENTLPGMSASPKLIFEILMNGIAR